MGEEKKAYDAWDEALDKNPNSIVAYRVITNYVVQNRAFDKAAEILERGKSITDDPSMFSYDLGNIYAAQMKFKDAAKEYCTILESQQNQLNIVQSRIQSYLNKEGASESTIEVINSFIDNNPKPQLIELLMFVYQKDGDFQNAFDSAVRLDKMIRSNGTKVYGFAQQAYGNEKYDIASKAYKYVIDKYPNENYIPIAKIGYAKTLEASLDAKTEKESWKPIQPIDTSGAYKYNKIIDAYQDLTKEYPDNEIFNEANFRIAKIYNDKFLNTEKADSLYKFIVNKNPLSGYTIMSYKELGDNAVKRNEFNKAAEYYSKAMGTERGDRRIQTYAQFMTAKLEFWNGNFSEALKKLAPVSRNYKDDLSNDAIELITIINVSKGDSLNLDKLAHADLLIFQNKLKEASVLYQALNDSSNLFLIKELAKFKYAQLKIAENNLPVAAKVLQEIFDDKEESLYSDKALFLLANLYQYGIADLSKAKLTYEKFLEKYPNSIYFDKSRENLNNLITNES
jgi:tetratricopeptide (TPR) repeat protein